MKSISLALTILFFHVTNGFSQNITGSWQGVLYQGPGGLSSYYPFSMQISQTGNTVTGTTLSKQPNSIYYVKDSLKGTFNNPLFSFQTHIYDQLSPPGSFWCEPTAKLIYNGASETLKGPWNASPCSPGTIEVWRLKMISDTIFCNGQPINLNVTGENVKWYSDSSLSTLQSTGNTYSPHITTTTTYYITQTHFNTESPAIAVRITVKPKSFLTINQSICQGRTYAGYNVSGNYTDTFAAANGCDSIRSLHLTVHPKQTTIIDTSICYGGNVEGYYTSGTYIDKFQSVNGCDSIRTIKLAIVSLPHPDLGPDAFICQGDSIILNPGNFPAYKWQDGSTEKRFVVKQPGLYSVTVTNSCGIANDKILITGNTCGIYFPNALTPNNDGKNDVFKALNAYDLQDFNLAVYNRWGQKVFETADYTKGWNGYYKGQLQSSGVYVWYCKYKINNLAMNSKGTVVLIR